MFDSLNEFSSLLTDHQSLVSESSRQYAALDFRSITYIQRFSHKSVPIGEFFVLPVPKILPVG